MSVLGRSTRCCRRGSKIAAYSSFTPELITHADKGVLFVGNGGAGKVHVVDFVPARRHGLPRRRFHRARCRGRSIRRARSVCVCLLNVQHIKRFPDLQPLAHAPNYDFEEKFVLYLTEAFPACLRQRVAIDALMLPRVVDAEVTTFRPATKAATLWAIAPTSVMLLPRPNREAFERLTQLVQRHAELLAGARSSRRSHSGRRSGVGGKSLNRQRGRIDQLHRARVQRRAVRRRGAGQHSRSDIEADRDHRRRRWFN